MPVLWGGGMAWTLSDAKLLRRNRSCSLAMSALGYGIAFLPKVLSVMDDRVVETSRASAQLLPPDFVRAMLAGHSALGLAFAALIYVVCLSGTLCGLRLRVPALGAARCAVRRAGR